MPNWCNNLIEIDFGKELGEDVLKIISDKNLFFSEFCKHLKIPKDEISNEEMGTKWWPFSDDLFRNLTSKSCNISFDVDSAWSPPNEALITILEMFGWKSITNSYIEEGMCYAGTFRVDEDDHYDDNIEYNSMYIEHEGVHVYFVHNDSDVTALEELVCDDSWVVNKALGPESYPDELKKMLVLEKLSS